MRGKIVVCFVSTNIVGADARKCGCPEGLQP